MQISVTEDTAVVSNLAEEVRRLRERLAAEQVSHQQTKERLEEVLLKEDRKELGLKMEGGGGGGMSIEEKTIMSPESAEVLLPGATGGSGGRELEELTQQLKVFCSEAERISLPM